MNLEGSLQDCICKWVSRRLGAAKRLVAFQISPLEAAPSAGLGSIRGARENNPEQALHKYLLCSFVPWRRRSTDAWRSSEPHELTFTELCCIRDQQLQQPSGLAVHLLDETQLP